VSAFVDNDDYFELMLRNAWHLTGGVGAAANSTNRRVLVTHADGRQSVEELRDDLGLAAGDTAAMLANLCAQGLHVVSVDLGGGVGTVDVGELDDDAAAAAREGGACGGEPAVGAGGGGGGGGWGGRSATTATPAAPNWVRSEAQLAGCVYRETNEPVVRRQDDKFGTSLRWAQSWR
jgi:hypothetical protein